MLMKVIFSSPLTFAIDIKSRMTIPEETTWKFMAETRRKTIVYGYWRSLHAWLLWWNVR